MKNDVFIFSIPITCFRPFTLCFLTLATIYEIMKATLDPQNAFWKHEENDLPGCVHYQKLQNPDKENWEINNLYM